MPLTISRTYNCELTEYVWSVDRTPSNKPLSTRNTLHPPRRISRPGRWCLHSDWRLGLGLGANRAITLSCLEPPTAHAVRRNAAARRHNKRRKRRPSLATSAKCAHRGIASPVTPPPRPKSSPAVPSLPRPLHILQSNFLATAAISAAPRSALGCAAAALKTRCAAAFALLPAIIQPMSNRRSAQVLPSSATASAVGSEISAACRGRAGRGSARAAR